MKGFVFRYKNEEIKIGVNKGGILKAILSNFKGASESYVGSIDYINSETRSWNDFIRLDIGEKLEVELTDIGENSHLMYFTKEDITNHIQPNNIKSKLEMFLELEADLKERKLL